MVTLPDLRGYLVCVNAEGKEVTPRMPARFSVKYEGRLVRLGMEEPERYAPGGPVTVVAIELRAEGQRVARWPLDSWSRDDRTNVVLVA